jgi:antitoxin MazE
VKRLAGAGLCDYRNHALKTTELTVTRVGNSRGVRLPAEVLRRYQIGDTLIMEERPDDIVLRPKRTRRQELTWAETYQQMARADEDWSEWESLPERLTAVPGEAGK